MTIFKETKQFYLLKVKYQHLNA